MHKSLAKHVIVDRDIDCLKSTAHIVIRKCQEMQVLISIFSMVILGGSKDVFEVEVQGGPNTNMMTTSTLNVGVSATKKRKEVSTSKRKGKCGCWDQFEKIRVVKRGKPRCIRKYCKRKFSCSIKGRTSHLLHHMRSCFKRDKRDVNRTILTSINQGNILLSSTSFSFEMSCELLAITMAMHNMPFQFVEYKVFRAYFQYIHN